MITLQVATKKRDEFVEITNQIQAHVHQAGIRQGAVIVYVPHTTAGITINENADPDVVHDMLLTLKRLVPQDSPGFRHVERNSDSHVKTAMMGNSSHILIEDGRLVLGTWQGIYLCEFDGPRTRKVHIQILQTAN